MVTENAYIQTTLRRIMLLVSIGISIILLLLRLTTSNVYAAAIEMTEAKEENKVIIRDDVYGANFQTKNMNLKPSVQWELTKQTNQLAGRVFTVGIGKADIYHIMHVNFNSKMEIYAHYRNAAYYKKKPVDVTVKWSNFRETKPDGEFFISTALYNGWVFRGIREYDVEFWLRPANSSPDAAPIQMEEGSFLTINSLNGVDDKKYPYQKNPGNIGEFVGGLSGQQEYVIPGHNLRGNRVGNTYVLEGNPYSKFDDRLGSDDFWRNSAMFTAKGGKQKFIMGAGYYSAWLTFSSQLIVPVKPPAPQKDVVNAAGASINNGEIDVGEKATFVLDQEMPSLLKTIRLDYKSLTVVDPVPNGFTITGLRAEPASYFATAIHGNQAHFAVSDMGRLFRDKIKKARFYIDGYFTEPNVTYKNIGYLVYGKDPWKPSNEVTVRTKSKVKEAPLTHYDYDIDKSGSDQKSWIKTEKIPLKEHNDLKWRTTTDWEKVPVKNEDGTFKRNENGDIVTEWERVEKEESYYDHYYSYEFKPRKDLKKITDHGTFNYVFWDNHGKNKDKVYKDDRVEDWEVDSLKIKVPYIVPRVHIYPKKIIIDTDDAEDGLPFQLYADKEEELYNDPSKDFEKVTIHVKIIDKTNGQIAFEDDVPYSSLNTFTGRLKVTGHDKGEKIDFNIEFSEGQNPDAREVLVEKTIFDTYGFTASHKELKDKVTESESSTELYQYDGSEGPLRTEKEIGDSPVKVYYERINVKLRSGFKTKTGYGIPTDFVLSYTNDLNKSYNTDVSVEVPKSMFTKNDDYGQRSNGLFNNNVNIDLDGNEYPHVGLKKGTGRIQLWTGDKTHYQDGKRLLYVPIWHRLSNEIGKVRLHYKFKNGTVGLNKFSLNMNSYIDIYAYMYGNTYKEGSKAKESTTIKKDEIWMRPNMSNTDSKHAKIDIKTNTLINKQNEKIHIQSNIDTRFLKKPDKDKIELKIQIPIKRKNHAPSVDMVNTAIIGTEFYQSVSNIEKETKDNIDTYIIHFNYPYKQEQPYFENDIARIKFDSYLNSNDIENYEIKPFKVTYDIANQKDTNNSNESSKTNDDVVIAKSEGEEIGFVYKVTELNNGSFEITWDEEKMKDVHTAKESQISVVLPNDQINSFNRIIITQDEEKTTYVKENPNQKELTYKDIEFKTEKIDDKRTGVLFKIPVKSNKIIVATDNKDLNNIKLEKWNVLFDQLKQGEYTQKYKAIN